MQGNLRADLVDARILHQLTSGRRQSILLGSGLVIANATPTAIDAQVGLDAGPIGTIDGRIALDRSTASLAGHAPEGRSSRCIRQSWAM